MQRSACVLAVSVSVAVAALAAVAAATPRAGFASYRDARLLCAEHVTGTGMHVMWSSYASKDDVATIAAHYEKTTGRKATTGTKGERHLEWDADHKLDIYPAARNDAFPHCAKKPGRGERSVILMSSVVRDPG
jgi:hypothetical protein